MRHLLCLSTCLLWLLPLNLARAEEEGFVRLFDGRSLDGWTIHCQPADREKAREFFTVEGGTILVDSSGSTDHDYVWLATERGYGDFVLRLRFQVARGIKGNSGVQIRSRYDREAGYLDGPQVDVHPPDPWRTGMMWDETRGAHGWLYPAVPEGEWVDRSMAPEDFKFFYADEGDGWNDFEISAKGMKLRAVLNGVEVMRYDGTGTLDDEVHRQHRVGRRGIIALQIHRGDQLKMRYKDLRIKPLEP